MLIVPNDNRMMILSNDKGIMILSNDNRMTIKWGKRTRNEQAYRETYLTRTFLKSREEGKKSVSICYTIRIQEYEEREKNPSKSQPVRHSVKVLEDDFGLSLREI